MEQNLHNTVPHNWCFSAIKFGVLFQ